MIAGRNFEFRYQGTTNDGYGIDFPFSTEEVSLASFIESRFRVSADTEGVVTRRNQGERTGEVVAAIVPAKTIDGVTMSRWYWHDRYAGKRIA